MNDSIHPHLTYFVRKKCNTSWRIEDQQIFFYDLVFILDGVADYTINGDVYRIKKGDILFIRSGSRRQASTKGMVCVSLDFTLNTGDSLSLPTLSSRPDFEDFYWIFRELDFEWLQKREGYQLKCQALFSLILHKLMFEGKQAPANAHVEEIKRYIVEHYDRKLKISTLAKIANIHPVYCGALFKKLEGRSISEFIKHVRINKASSLLESGEYNVGEVAEKTGFSDIYYFSSTFKQLIGLSPSSYKNRFAAARTQEAVSHILKKR